MSSAQPLMKEFSENNYSVLLLRNNCTIFLLPNMVKEAKNVVRNSEL